MGQYFRLFNIDKRTEAAAVGGGKFGEWWPETAYSRSLVDLLLPAALEFPPDPLEGTICNGARKRDLSRIGLCDLPTELHLAIFQELQDPLDVVALCLASCHFWKTGVARIRTLYRASREPFQWAGNRIIVMGDYARDWPEGVLTETELEHLIAEYELRSGMLDDYDDDDDDDDDDEANASYSVLSTLCSRQTRSSWPPSYKFTERCPLFWYKPIPDPTIRRAQNYARMSHYKYDMGPWLDLGSSPSCPDPKLAYVLANISKQVYVRADLLCLDPKDVNGPYIRGMTFDSLITAKTVWSNDSSMSMSYVDDLDPNFHRGPWAGDRFEIVTLSTIESREGWRDVTVDAKNELSAIWESEHGSKWTDMIRHRW